MAKRSYFQEVEEIALTWASVRDAKNNIDELSSSWISGSVFCIGSGGALCLARLWQSIHESHKLGIAKTITPYEFHHNPNKPDLVVLFSASGKNHDILDVCRVAISQNCKVLIFTIREKSPLVKLAKTYPNQVKIVLPNVAVPQDGFLAVNSTVAMGCMIAKIENHFWNVEGKLGDPICDAINDHTDFVVNNISGVDGRTIHIITSEWGKPAAVDFEARLAESGLTNCFVTDPRNFGHGRFIWLEKRNNSSQIVFFYEDQSKSLINRITRLIPDNIECIKITTKYKNSLGGIYLIARSILLFAAYAKNLDYDPGMPDVPDWGRKLHRLKIQSNFPKSNKNTVTKNPASLPAFTIPFSGIALDFDGTIVDTKKRYDSITGNMISQLERLLSMGLKIGVATGRGRSAYEALKKQIEKKYHKNLYVGLYNGTLVGKLDAPLPPPNQGWYLREHIERLIHSTEVDLSKISSRETQISIRGIAKKKIKEISNFISASLQDNSRYVKFCESAHSLDILPHWATKVTLVHALMDNINMNILCLGDQGQIGGNDEELLSWIPSISVGNQQPASNLCYWLGKDKELRESQGTLKILRNVVKEGDVFRLKTLDMDQSK